jgi:hypothetical protein
MQVRMRAAAVMIIALGGALGGVPGQLDQRPFVASLEHPAIEYATRPVRDPVAQLNRLLDEGARQLTFEPAGGYLQRRPQRPDRVADRRVFKDQRTVNPHHATESAHALLQ